MNRQEPSFNRPRGARRARDDDEVLPMPLPAAAFDEFWARYPRKVAKRRAETAWRSAVKRAKPAVILKGLDRSLAAWRAEQRASDKIPYPATWLNGDCWADELESRRGGAAGVLDRFAERAAALEQGRPLAALGPGL